jgi:hypothetical protein
LRLEKIELELGQRFRRQRLNLLLDFGRQKGGFRRTFLIVLARYVVWSKLSPGLPGSPSDCGMTPFRP